MRAPSGWRAPLPLSGVLALLLPTAAESELLRALLWPAERGVRAWVSWRADVGGLRAVLPRDTRGLNALLPFLGHVLRADRLTLDSDDRACLRSAQLRESARYEAYRTILRDVLSQLAARGIPTLLLDGAALAHTVYAAPALRHCHDIALLVPDARLAVASALLIESGLRPEGRRTPATAGLVALRHRSGLPVRLDPRLLPVALPGPSADELWDRGQAVDLSGAGARVLSDADALLRVCGRAAFTPRASPLVWTCDVWLLLTRRPQLDWDRFLAGARRANLVLPIAPMLAYLANELEAPIPAHVLAAVERAARRADSVGRQIAVEGVRRSGGVGLRELARRARSPRDRLALARWMLIPSPEYVRLVSEDGGSPGVLRYCVERALRYARRRLGARRPGSIAHPPKGESGGVAAPRSSGEP